MMMIDPAVFSRKPVKLLKKRYVGIWLVGVKHDTRQEILSFQKFWNVLLSDAIEDRVHVIKTWTHSDRCSYILSDGGANVMWRKARIDVIA